MKIILNLEKWLKEDLIEELNDLKDTPIYEGGEKFSKWLTFLKQEQDTELDERESTSFLSVAGLYIFKKPE